jgi:pilus assembly protein Flp/PilA
VERLVDMLSKNNTVQLRMGNLRVEMRSLWCKVTEASHDAQKNITDRTERAPRMKLIAGDIKRFLQSEDGPTAVEYAVMLALIVVICLTAIKAVGTNANNKFTAVKNALT